MRTIFASLLVLAAVAALAACPANNPPQPPPNKPDPSYRPIDAGPEAHPPITLTDAAPARGTPGAACVAATDCDSGVCEGEGCGADVPGHCADKRRMCTMDLQDYCGCDGATFSSSGSCPGRRYDHRGACAVTAQTPPPPPAKKQVGEACSTGDDCAAGVCEGQGCGDDHPGTCADPARRCARNRVPYCGCDGKTFTTSSTCQRQRYQHAGKC